MRSYLFRTDGRHLYQLYLKNNIGRAIICNIFEPYSFLRGYQMRPATASFKSELLTVLPKARRFALTLVRDSSDADDLVQTAVEKALKNSTDFEKGTNMGAWLNKIIRNTFYDVQKSHAVSKTDVVGDDNSILENSTSTENPAMNQIEVEEVQEFLFSLPDTERSVVMLWAEGYSYDEIAQELSLSRGNAGVILCRARKLINDHFGGHGIAV